MSVVSTELSIHCGFFLGVDGIGDLILTFLSSLAWKCFIPPNGTVVKLFPTHVAGRPGSTGQQPENHASPDENYLDFRRSVIDDGCGILVTPTIQDLTIDLERKTMIRNHLSDLFNLSIFSMATLLLQLRAIALKKSLSNVPLNPANLKFHPPPATHLPPWSSRLNWQVL